MKNYKWHTDIITVKKIVNLYTESGLSTREIAKRCNISKSSVHRRIKEFKEGKYSSILYDKNIDVMFENENKIVKTIIEVGKGRSFVRIHRVREYLDWPYDVFNKTLKSLAYKGKIELHGGDPSEMSTKELHNSYITETGELWITLSLR